MTQPQLQPGDTCTDTTGHTWFIYGAHALNAADTSLHVDELDRMHGPLALTHRPTTVRESA
ncbi:hypothetical protein AB0395_44825 [Streptosporangium sp. NPDC051023]|uniref:hypothetical protein n=1 Tax=Streptosporangium sp. NPDC051023 TaxID=3155410 RepID=UPI00344FC077